jgi:putative N6-adenine-specific DNA methylase
VITEGNTGLEEDKAYQRHLKHYVQAPVHQFAAVSPPELTAICHEELIALGFSETRMTEAGVEFNGKLRSCYAPNLCLRTASRILCRLPPFRAGATEELFHKISNVRWELWLNPKVPLDLRAFVEYSRISHEGLVAQTVIAGIERRFHTLHQSPPERLASVGGEEGEGAANPPLKQRVLVHLHRNHCQISLDTTGDHLHRRGYRLAHTGAPLRETLAAAILLRSKWTGDVPLIDGMSGAGTVAIEAALLARSLPPGLTRAFLFELWPSFQERTWTYLRKTTAEQVLAQARCPVLAVDWDPGALTIARKNAQRAGVDGDIRWQDMDFFACKPQDLPLPPGLLVLDPPYGKRLESGGKELYEKLGHHLRRFFAGWQTAVLVPNKTLAMSLRLPSMRLWQISHGGTPVHVVLGRI